VEAQSLTVSVPQSLGNPLCDKNCPYCISKMTGYVQPDETLFIKNITKVKKMAEMARVPSVLLTGKGEPLLNFDKVCYILDQFNEFPLEIQTNGIWLHNHIEYITALKQAGLDTIAISIDNLNQMDTFSKMIEAIINLNMTCRICLNLTDKIIDVSFRSIFYTLKNYGIHQLIVRNIMVPKVTQNTDEARQAIDWISLHTDSGRYIEMYKVFKTMVNEEVDLIRTLPYGSEVYNLDGISVSFSDYCLQESNNTNDIRSLIFLEDGHVYTSWDKIPASRLF